ncbi:MAG: hypothetical protein AB7U77_03350 [Methanothrix sp.]
MDRRGYSSVSQEVTLMSIMDHVLVVVIFGVLVVALPWLSNKWSDSRSGVR